MSDPHHPQQARAMESPSPSAGPGVNAAEPLVQALLDDLVDDDPVLASALGLATGAGRLPSWSADAVARRLRMAAGHAERLTPLVRDPDRGTAADAFLGLQITHRVQRTFGLREVHRTLPGAYLEVLFGVYPLLLRELGSAEERVDALAGRLLAAPGLLEEARENLERRLPAVVVEVAVDQAAGLLELLGPTARDFAREAGSRGLSTRHRKRRARPSRPSASFCAASCFATPRRPAEPVAPSSTTSCAGSTCWTTVPRTSPTTAARCSPALAGMRTLARKTGIEDVAAAVAAIRARHPRAGGVVAAYGDAVRDARAFVATHDIATLPEDEELEVVATPPFLKHPVPFAAYEPPGPYNARQLGYYYVTPPRDGLDADSLERALRNHPYTSRGHDRGARGLPRSPSADRPGQPRTDAGASRRLRPRRRRYPRRGVGLLLRRADGARELVSDPADRLMRLNDQALACLSGRHRRRAAPRGHGLRGRRRASCRRPRTWTAYEAEIECRRYAVKPGQAMSYLLGRRALEHLAARYSASRPASLREFHDELLELGRGASGGHRLGDGSGAPATRRSDRPSFRAFLDALSRSCWRRAARRRLRPAALARYRALSASSMRARPGRWRRAGRSRRPRSR